MRNSKFNTRSPMATLPALARPSTGGCFFVKKLNYMKHGPRFIDITGQMFHKCLIKGFHGKNKNNQSLWDVLCFCGEPFVALGGNLKKANHTTSCGCVRSKVCIERSTKHGLCQRKGRRKEWYAMKGAIDRCENPNAKQYKWYGAKGVKVCKGFNDPAHFVAVLGLCPPNKYSVGRIETNLHYSCGSCDECRENEWLLNCRWEDRIQQMNNMTSNHYVLHEGEKMSVAELARRIGRPYKKVYADVIKGAYSSLKPDY